MHVEGTRRSVGGVVAVALAALSWGTVGVVGQRIQTRSDVGPEAVAFLRLAIAAAVLVLCAGFSRNTGERLPRRARWVLVWAGIALAANQLFYFLAIDKIGVAAAALLTLGLSPVIAAALEAFVERAVPTRSVALAMVLALLGLGLLSEVTSLHESEASGVAFSVVSAACFALVALARRGLPNRASPIGVTAATMTVASVALLPVAARSAVEIELDVTTVASLLYVGVGATALAYFLYFRGLETTRASVALLVVLLEPLTASVLGVVLEGERLGGSRIAGAIILLVSVVISSVLPERARRIS